MVSAKTGKLCVSLTLTFSCSGWKSTMSVDFGWQNEFVLCMKFVFSLGLQASWRG